MGAGLSDLDKAITDLQTAARIEPKHAEVRSLLSRLEKERAAQRTKDRRHFDSLFDDDDSNELLDKYKDRITKMNESDSLEKRIEDAVMLRDLYRRNGKEEGRKTAPTNYGCKKSVKGR